MPFYCFAWCGVLTLALFCTFGAFADEEPAVTGFKVRLESAATIVRTQNPSLAAARFSIGEARGRLRQAGLLSNPEAETSFQHDPRWREFGAEVGLTQDIPVTARLRHEKEVSLAELQAAEAEVADLERRLIGQVRETLVMILALQEQKTNQAKQAKLLQELLTFIESQVGKGEASSLDANQVKVERTQLGLAMRRLEIERDQAIDSLKPMLGIHPHERLLVVDQLPSLPQWSSVQDDVDKRPDVQAASHLARAAERDILLERARRYDDLSVGLFMERARVEDAPEGLERETSVGVRVSFPIPFWNKNEGTIEEKTATLARRAQELVVIEKNAAHEMATARQSMKLQLDLLTDIDTTLIPEATKHVAHLEQAYQQGLTDLQTVLRARRQLVELSAARIDALRDYHRARVQLETSLALP